MGQQGVVEGYSPGIGPCSAGAVGELERVDGVRDHVINVYLLCSPSFTEDASVFPVTGMTLGNLKLGGTTALFEERLKMSACTPGTLSWFNVAFDPQPCWGVYLLQDLCKCHSHRSRSSKDHIVRRTTIYIYTLGQHEHVSDEERKPTKVHEEIS